MDLYNMFNGWKSDNWYFYLHFTAPFTMQASISFMLNQTIKQETSPISLSMIQSVTINDHWQQLAQLPNLVRNKKVVKISITKQFPIVDMMLPPIVKHDFPYVIVYGYNRMYWYKVKIIKFWACQTVDRIMA